jgi:hypothetical protein
VALRRLRSDLQAAVDLERWAREQRDRDLYLALQDQALPGWVGQQDLRYVLYRDPCASGPWAASSVRQANCAPGPRPEVTKVRLRKEVARVEVVEGLPPMRYVRFYRQTEDGWVHTAPRVEFWKEPVERNHGPVTVRARRDDLAHVEPLVEHLARAVDEVSAALGEGEPHKLEVEFTAQDLPGQAPGLTGDRIVLASPQLTGTPVEGAWTPEQLDRLEYWAAYWAVSRYVQPAGETSYRPAPVKLLHKALVDEYAVFYSRGDLAQAPLLHQVVEQHGLDALPEMLSSLRASGDAPAFLARWLLAAPRTDNVYLDTLVDIGRKAVACGRQSSFSLVLVVLERYGAKGVERVETTWFEGD